MAIVYGHVPLSSKFADANKGNAIGVGGWVVCMWGGGVSDQRSRRGGGGGSPDGLSKTKHCPNFATSCSICSLKFGA